MFDFVGFPILFGPKNYFEVIELKPNEIPLPLLQLIIWLVSWQSGEIMTQSF